MVMLAALAFLTTLIFVPFVFFPSRLFAWFDRNEDQTSEDFVTMQARFAHVSKRLCAAPMILGLVAGIYCVTQVRAENQRRLAQDETAAVRADKAKKYGSASAYTQPDHKSRFETEQH